MCLSIAFIIKCTGIHFLVEWLSYRILNLISAHAVSENGWNWRPVKLCTRQLYFSLCQVLLLYGIVYYLFQYCILHWKSVQPLHTCVLVLRCDTSSRNAGTNFWSGHTHSSFDVFNNLQQITCILLYLTPLASLISLLRGWWIARHACMHAVCTYTQFLTLSFNIPWSYL